MIKTIFVYKFINIQNISVISKFAVGLNFEKNIIKINEI